MQRPAQSPLRRFFTSRAFLISALVITSLTAFGFARAYYQDYKVREQIAELQAEVGKLETRKIASMQLLQYVTSQQFVEDKARTELNLRQPGEHMAVISNSTRATAVETAPGVDKPPLSNTWKWWYYFTAHRSPDRDRSADSSNSST